MNAIVTMSNTGCPVTTSLAISDGVGNPHASVIKLIRQNLADFEEFGRVGFEIQPFETAGGPQNREVAILNEQQATLLLTYMRNNDVVREFKKRLVKAFFELAKQSPQVDPMQALQDPATMRGLLLSYSEKVLALESKVKEQEAKVEALDRIATADGGMCITNAAKDLQVRPKDLFKWMSANRWIYRRTGSTTWTAYQERIQQGVLEHKVTTVEKDDGTTKVVEQVLVTAKGLAKLAEQMRNRVA